MNRRRFPPRWFVEELDLLCQRRTKAVAAILRVPDRDFLSRFPDQVSIAAVHESASLIGRVG